MSPGAKVLRVAGIALKAIFWSALAAEVGWLVLASTASSSRRSSGVSSVWCTSSYSAPSPSPRACSSCWKGGPIKVQRARAPVDAYGDAYATVCFVSLFFGFYAFVGWFYSCPPPRSRLSSVTRARHASGYRDAPCARSRRAGRGGPCPLPGGEAEAQNRNRTCSQENPGPTAVIRARSPSPCFPCSM